MCVCVQASPVGRLQIFYFSPQVAVFWRVALYPEAQTQKQICDNFLTLPLRWETLSRIHIMSNFQANLRQMFEGQSYLGGFTENLNLSHTGGVAL